MKDSNNREVSIGDEVAYVDGYGGSAIYISTGVVVGMTAKRFKVAPYIGHPVVATLVQSSRIIKLDTKKVVEAADRLRNFLSWSDRIGSDEIYELRAVIERLEK